MLPRVVGVAGVKGDGEEAEAVEGEGVEDDPNPNTEEIPSQVRPPERRGPFEVVVVEEAEAEESAGASAVEDGV
jgi:hypothetical protein